MTPLLRPPRLRRRRSIRFIGLAHLPYAHIGLTRAAGVVCPGDGASRQQVCWLPPGDWIIRRSRPIIATVCAKKLSGRLAKSEVPDTVAPTHSTASRGQFATLGESSRYFNHPKTI